MIHQLRFALLTAGSLAFGATANAQFVDNAADDGSDGTLRQEILDTPPGGTITFAPTVTNIVLNSELTIDKTLTIRGNLGNTTVDANNNSRIFNVTNATLTLEDMDLENGVAADGGAITTTDATLMLTNTNISNSTANGASGSGGAILVGPNSQLVANGGSFTGNVANRAGGAIEVNSTLATVLTLSNVDFSNNNAGVTPAVASPGNGGAIHITGSGNSSITGGVATGNVAASEGGAFWNGTGTMTIDGTTFNANIASGPMANHGGGAVFNAGGTVEIEGSAMSDNEADGTAGSGGAVLNDQGTLTVSNSTFTNNVAVRAGGAIEDNSSASGMLTIDTVTFIGNTATNGPGNGGAIHITGSGSATITGGLASNNTAGAEGGAFWNGTGSMTVERVDFSGNVASGSSADQGGGALFNAGGNLMVMSSVFTSNEADGSAGSGGAIFNDQGGLFVDSSSFSNNTSVRAGGAIEINSSGIATTNIIDVEFNDNDAGSSPGNGGAIHITGGDNTTIVRVDASGNVAGGQGGAFWNGSGEMTIEGSFMFNNTASGDNADQGGGAVYNLSGDLSIMTSAMEQNTADGASGSGGAVLIKEGTVVIDSSSLENNAAVRAGGAIEIIDGTLTVSASEMLENNVDGQAGIPAPGSGGGIHVTGNSTQVTVENSVVSNNDAALTGGGLWNQSGSTMTVINTTLDGNTATGGGAIFNTGGTINIEGSALTNNSASNDGGAILNNSGSIDLKVSTISGNDAGNNGGGITSMTAMTINAVTIVDNSASNNGGGIMSNSDVTITNTLMSDNTAFGTGQNISGDITSMNYNLIASDDEGNFSAQVDDLVDVSPTYGPLQVTAGLTATHALAANSAGIDKGNPDDTFEDQADQPAQGRRDIGAYEYQGAANTIELAEENFTVYPNPTRDVVQINFDGQTTMRLYNQAGQVVKTIEVTASGQTLDMHDLDEGVYFLKDDESSAFKIVKM